RNKAVNRRIVLRRWGDALSRRKQLPEAAAKYHEALNLESGDEETHRGFRELGNALRSELRFNEAIEQYRIADQLYEAAKSVDRINLLQDWGDALLEQDSPIEAKLKYEEARDCDPDEPDPYWRIGLALATREDFDRAVEQYAEAEKRWRGRGESTPDYVLRSWAYDLASLERFDDAVRK